MNTTIIIYQLLKHKCNMFWKSLKTEKKVKSIERTECFFDECQIMDKYLMSFKNEIRLINYTESKIIKYSNINDLIANDANINIIMKSILSNEIITYIHEKYKDHFVNITTDESSLRYSVQVIHKTNLIRLFSEVDTIDEIEKEIEKSIGFRYINEYRENGSTKYKCMSLYLHKDQIVNGSVFNMSSNFKSLLDIFNKDTTKVTDIFLVNDQFMKTINKDNIVGYNDILKCILGDNKLEDYIKFNKIF